MSVALLVLLGLAIVIGMLVLWQLVHLEHRLLNGESGLLFALETESRSVRRGLSEINTTLRKLNEHIGLDE